MEPEVSLFFKRGRWTPTLTGTLKNHITLQSLVLLQILYVYGNPSVRTQDHKTERFSKGV